MATGMVVEIELLQICRDMLRRSTFNISHAPITQKIYHTPIPQILFLIGGSYYRCRDFEWVIDFVMDNAVDNGQNVSLTADFFFQVYLVRYISEIIVCLVESFLYALVLNREITWLFAFKFQFVFWCGARNIHRLTPTSNES